MLPINLTPEEVKSITGFIKFSAQIRWLRANGFIVLERADGKPVISRSHFELKMGGIFGQSKQKEHQPNLGAI